MQPSQPEKQPRNPAKSAWQRKWLKLDITSPEVQEMATATEKFCAKWFKGDKNGQLLVLTGASGVGKTKCAKAAFEWAQRMAFPAMEAGGWGLTVPSVMGLRWPAVADAFKAGEYGVLQDCFEVSFLMLDDVGAEHDPSKNAADKLCQILSRREHKYTVITTNIQPALWVDKFDQRIADRFLRNSVVVDLSTTKSYALQAK